MSTITPLAVLLSSEAKSRLRADAVAEGSGRFDAEPKERENDSGGENEDKGENERRETSGLPTMTSSSLASSSSLLLSRRRLRRPSLTSRTKSHDAKLDDADEPSGPLNTNTPRALAAAAAITNERIGKFLIATGPLSIRHITTHLSISVASFAELSLSKQRRLIMSVLEGPEDTTITSAITTPPATYSFEKVGWGRWAARLGNDRTKPSSSSSSSSPVKSPPVKSPYLSAQSLASNIPRRDSISDNLYQRGHLFSVPVSPLLMAKPGGATVPEEDILLDSDTLFEDKGRGQYLESAILDDSDEENSDSEDYSESPYSLYARSLSTSANLRAYRFTQTQNLTPNCDTDEEDWQSVGAEGLRVGKFNHTTVNSTIIPTPAQSLEPSPSLAPYSYGKSWSNLSNLRYTQVNPEKELAAVSALVQLRNV